MNLKHLKDLQVRVARLEKSAVYYPSLNESLDPRNVGYSVEKGVRGTPYYERHYESRINPISSLGSLRRFEYGQRLKRSEIANMIRELYAKEDSTCMVSNNFTVDPKHFSLKIEKGLATKRNSEEQYYEDVADRLDDRDEVIRGEIGVIIFPHNKRGEGYLIY